MNGRALMELFFVGWIVPIMYIGIIVGNSGILETGYRCNPV